MNPMYRPRYPFLLVLLLTVLLPAVLSAKKKDRHQPETSLLTIDEQQYFDSLYFLAVTQEQCERPDSAVSLMRQAVAFIMNGDRPMPMMRFTRSAFSL